MSIYDPGDDNRPADALETIIKREMNHLAGTARDELDKLGQKLITQAVRVQALEQQLTAERERVKALEAERADAAGKAKCAFCGETAVIGIELAEHMVTCAKHPMAKITALAKEMETELEELRSQLAEAQATLNRPDWQRHLAVAVVTCYRNWKRAGGDKGSCQWSDLLNALSALDAWREGEEQVGHV